MLNIIIIFLKNINFCINFFKHQSKIDLTRITLKLNKIIQLIMQNN